jgi:hypothetical protein
LFVKKTTLGAAGKVTSLQQQEQQGLHIASNHFSGQEEEVAREQLARG